MKFYLLSLCLWICADVALAGSSDYSSSRVGCFSRLASAVGLNCTEQRLGLEALKSLFHSSRADSREKLRSTVMKRADYFLAKKEFDYFSIVSMMLFKVAGSEEKLEQFRQLPGKRAPFAQIALDRLKNDRSSYCVSSKGEDGVAIFLREICDINLKDK